MNVYELKQHAERMRESVQKLLDFFESVEDTVERDQPDEINDEVRQRVLDSVSKAMSEKNAHVSMTWNRPVKRVFESMGSEHPKLVPLGPVTVTVSITYGGR
jgi:predicted transcriptional regulator